MRDAGSEVAISLSSTVGEGRERVTKTANDLDRLRIKSGLAFDILAFDGGTEVPWKDHCQKNTCSTLCKWYIS